MILRLHQFIKTKRRGSRDEMATRLGIGKNKLADLLRILNSCGAQITYNRSLGCYEYLNDFEFFLGPVRKERSTRELK